MKRIWTLLLCLVMLCSLAACAETNEHSQSDTSTQPSESTEPAMSQEELVALLRAEKVYAFDADVQYGREDGRPRLSSDIQNNSDSAIKGITLAYAAWDANGKPVEMNNASGTLEASHIREVYFPAVTISANQSWSGEQNGAITGYIISAEHDNIVYVRSCVVSCTDSSGEVWENPCYETWKQVYFNKDLAI